MHTNAAAVGRSPCNPPRHSVPAGVSGPKGSSFPVRGQTLFVLKDPILGSFNRAHEIASAALFVLTEKNQVI